jgi:hypothetical protein
LQSGQFGTPMDLSGMPTAGQVPTAPGPFVWNPTMEGLAATPGYQFTLQQAQQAQQSSAAARGLGMSGAAMRGAADYAGGLASKTYDQQLQNAISIYGQGLTRFDKQLAGYNAGAAQFQNQFSDYWANQNNKFSNFYDLARLGANSAAQQGTTGTTAAQNIGNAAQMGANQQAAGIQGAGNALSTFANSPGVQSALTSLFGSNQTGTNLPGTPSYDPNLTVGGYRAPDNSWL